MRHHSVQQIWTGFLLGCLAATASAQEPPEALVPPDGAQVVLEKCVDCHTLRPVFRANYNRDGWNDCMTRMISEGLEIDDAQRWAAIDYLTEAVQVPEEELHGQPHFAVVHFPIALVFAWAIVELFGIWRREPLSARYAGAVLGWLTVASVLAAIITGFWLEHDRTTMPAEMASHKNLGMVTGVLLLGAVLTRTAAARWSARGWAYAYPVLLALSILGVSYTGHLGGLLVHGDVLQGWLR